MEAPQCLRRAPLRATAAREPSEASAPQKVSLGWR
jgi:hypothetical protein